MIAAELFRRYTDDAPPSPTSPAAHQRKRPYPDREGPVGPLGGLGMLRYPAYAGTAVFGKTQVLQESPWLNRRPAWRPLGAAGLIQDRRPAPRRMDRDPRPRHRDGRDVRPNRPALADNKRYAARNTKVPSLLQAWPPARPADTLLPHLGPHHQQEDLLLPVPRLRRLPLRRRPSAATSRSAPTTWTPSYGTTSPPCSPTPL